MGSFSFHPQTSAWFTKRVGTPTDVQAQAWPAIAAGGHVLVTAPTGTGKTLAAFLGGLDHLLTRDWEPGALRLLYISPLKALNNDIRRNLLVPLQELRESFLSAELCPPEVTVMVRSGDTPEDERRKLRRHPPEILITTPESLNILLTQKQAGTLFGGLKAVIIDEIHAVIGSKRGTALLTALERLVPMAGEFQRIGLSATVNPPGLVAQALGGFFPEGRARPVTLVASPAAKQYDVQVVLPEFRKESEETGKVFWESLALELRRRTRERASTLIFTNSRRACEKLARLMNEPPLGQEVPADLLAYSHHGSLSKEIRRDVELKLKDGLLKALVATNSLELGIDIGDLDEVILAQTPRTAASAIQKVGRAGHRTGETSRARLYPSHGIDLVEAAVIVRCIRDQTVEPVAIPDGPLDVLAQAILSAWSARPSTADELFLLFRCSWPYRNLNRQAFDLVVEMLAGRYAGTRISELKPRIESDPATGLWTAKPAVPFLLYSSGGTIPDRGYFTLRDLRTGTALGELDEEFVWERTLGDRFALGAQVWKIAAIDDQAVRVEPVQAPPHIIPFWKAEDQDRSWFLAEKIGLFLEEADRILGAGSPAWRDQLIQEGFSPAAAERLIHTLERERSAVGKLPHRWRMVVERVEPEKPGAQDRTDVDQYVVHTFWGARVNRPWAFALAQAWEDRFGYALETYPGDDQILILVPPETEIDEVLSQVSPANLEGLLRRRLEATGFFGARFREGAGRALLLPKPGFAKRTPLWQTRLRAKRLFEAVSRFPEFPILLEAWRQCLKDEFELEALKTLLEERQSGRITTWHCRTTAPSPFTEGLLWRQVNEKMYAGDEPPARKASGLDDSLWDQLLAPDRPQIPSALVDDWESRWGRTAPGYAPETAADLADLLEVRIALSESEWSELLAACIRDCGGGDALWLSSVPTVQRDGRVGVPGMADLWKHPEGLWLRWLEGRGPVALGRMASFWGQSSRELELWIQRESDAGTIVFGRLTQGAEEPEVCLARTWEQLVRRLRLVNRSSVPTRPAQGLPLFLGRHQGLTRPEQTGTTMEAVVGPLLGLPISAELWEGALLPSRCDPYRAADFDRLFIEGGLRWFGLGPVKIVLGFPEDRSVFLTPGDPGTEQDLDQIFGSSEPQGEVAFSDLSTRSGLALGPLTETLWDLAWKGAVSATTFGPLRKGLKNGFRYDRGTELERGMARQPAGGFQRWSAVRSSSGSWCRWSRIDTGQTQSALAELEEKKRRARLVLDRYGIVFRTLLTHEAPSFQWKALFPALRLMELSGEILGGMFWEGVPGLQFATPAALREWEAGGDETKPWVQHAQDPTSLCGLGLEVFPGLPRRVVGTWLWWKGERLAAILGAGGKKLDLGTELAPPAVETWSPWIQRMKAILLTEGKSRWTLETIDGREASSHPAAPAFREAGFQDHGEKLVCWKA